MNLCASHDIIRLLIHIAYSLTASIFTDDRLWAPAILVIKCSCIFTTVYMNADSVRRCWYHINWVGCKVGCVDSIAILREKRKTLFFSDTYQVTCATHRVFKLHIAGCIAIADDFIRVVYVQIHPARHRFCLMYAKTLLKEVATRPCPT